MAEKNQGDQKTKIKDAVFFSHQKKKIADYVLKAKIHLIDGEYNVYNPYQQVAEGALKIINENKDAFTDGEISIFLLPTFLVLVEAYLGNNLLQGKKDIKKAEQVMTAAYWNFRKNKKFDQQGKLIDSNEDKNRYYQELTKQQFLYYKTELNETFGKLYLYKREYAEAISKIRVAVIRHHKILLNAKKYGPENPITSLNYFIMGRIFIQSDKTKEGQSFFGKFVQIWYKYLKGYYKLSPQAYQQNELIDQIVLRLALTYLNTIQRYWQKNYSVIQIRNVFIPVMRTYYAIGLLYHIFKLNKQCIKYLKMAYKHCQTHLDKNHKTVIKIKGILNELGQNKDDQQQLEEYQESYNMQGKEQQQVHPQQNI